MIENIVLKIWIDGDSCPGLVEKYREHIEKHNESVTTDSHPNSGFDLFVPEDHEFVNNDCKLVNHRIKCAMYYDLDPAAFYLYARSSIYKTPLGLANSVGIIDSGYRGWICSALRSYTHSNYTLPEGTRITQICHPSLYPIYVQLVDSEEELGETTRGEGGFGSTGK
jgi:dUTP pyrophosphatase